MKFLLMTAAAVALSAGGASAQGLADQVVAGLQAQGFTRIEVDAGPTQVKVEVIRGTTKVEYVYDRATGGLLSQETEAVDADDDTRPGIEYDTRDDDFVRVGVGGSHDDDDDGQDDDGDDEGGDRNRGHGNDADGFDDDNPGRGQDDRADDDDDDGDDDDGEGRGRGRGRGRGGDD